MRCGSICALNCLQFECTIRWGGDEFGQVVKHKSGRSSHKSKSRYDLEYGWRGWKFGKPTKELPCNEDRLLVNSEAISFRDK